MRGLVKGFAVAVAAMGMNTTAAMEPEELSCGVKFDTSDKIIQCFADATAQSERDIESAKKGLLDALEVARGKLQSTPGIVVRPADDTLAKAQQAWRDYRDANCTYYDVVYAPVSAPGTEKAVCELRMTRQRARELIEERQFWYYKFHDTDTPPPELVPAP